MEVKQEMEMKLLKFIDGKQMSADETAEIQQWISSRKENKEYFEQIKKIWEEKKYLNDLKNVDLDKNWTRLQQAIRQNSDLPFSKSFIPGNRLIISRVAAAILILIISSTVLYFALNKPGHEIIQVSSPHENSELVLSDGSVITLKQGSILNYPEKLNRKKREITLSGEAYFEIAEMKASPFYVYIEDCTVKVLGTSFNLKAEARGKITVSVIRGIVLFYKSGNVENAVKLESGQEGIFNSITGEIEKSNFKSENFLYWKTARLDYKYESLAGVFGELGACFNKHLIVRDPEILRNRLTTSFEGQQFQDILNELALLFDLQYNSQGDTIYVTTKH